MINCNPWAFFVVSLLASQVIVKVGAETLMLRRDLEYSLALSVRLNSLH
jgi:hypothetical protein